MKESTIEKKTCEYAKSKGFLVFKFVSPNYRGVPDRIFIRAGKVFFIEFKTPGKKQTELQLKMTKDIQSQGLNVYICDDVDLGKTIINENL